MAVFQLSIDFVHHGGGGGGSDRTIRINRCAAGKPSARPVVGRIGQSVRPESGAPLSTDKL